MAYMNRLGIWGSKTPFKEFSNFIQAVERRCVGRRKTKPSEDRVMLTFNLCSLILYIRGVGAMEIVAMDMKLRGMYIARQLSFTGVTFKIEEVPLSQKYICMYNKSVRLVSEIWAVNQYGNLFIFVVLVVFESLSAFAPSSGCVHVRSFSRPHSWLMQSNAWRNLCGASSGPLIRGSLNTSVSPPRSAEWSSWPERRSRMERCVFAKFGSVHFKFYLYKVCQEPINGLFCY